jgi:hypothetical protein
VIITKLRSGSRTIQLAKGILSLIVIVAYFLSHNPIATVVVAVLIALPWLFWTFLVAIERI